MLAVDGFTVTVATGAGATVMSAVPTLPSLVATIVAAPAPPPYTRPAKLTVATDVSLLAQVTARPVSRLPKASLVTADNWRVAPSGTVAADGEMVTDATATSVTVTLTESPVAP